MATSKEFSDTLCEALRGIDEVWTDQPVNPTIVATDSTDLDAIKVRLSDGSRFVIRVFEVLHDGTEVQSGN